MSFRVAAQVVALLICGYGVVQLTGRFKDGPGQTATVAPPTREQGTDDPLNRGILIHLRVF